MVSLQHNVKETSLRRMIAPFRPDYARLFHGHLPAALKASFGRVADDPPGARMHFSEAPYLGRLRQKRLQTNGLMLCTAPTAMQFVRKPTVRYPYVKSANVD